VNGGVGITALFDIPVWFHSWDLDSGCIWDPAAIAHTNNIATLEKASSEWDPELTEGNEIVYHDQSLAVEKRDFKFHGARMEDGRK